MDNMINAFDLDVFTSDSEASEAEVYAESEIGEPIWPPAEELSESDDDIATDTGDYEYQFVEPVLPSQECPVCKLPMRDAVQTKDCGHRFCRSCLEQALRTANNCVCPACRSSVDQEEGEHKKDCLYEKIKCADCGEWHQRRNMESHQLSECEQRMVPCTFCNKIFPFIDLQYHMDEDCERSPLQCANECEYDPIPREEMQYHLENDCPMTIVKCSYENVGCQDQGKRCSISEHRKARMEEHLQLTTSVLSGTKNEVDEMKKKINALVKCVKYLEEKNNALEKQIGEVKPDKRSFRKNSDIRERRETHPYLRKT